jgi:hypothetical protein
LDGTGVYRGNREILSVTFVSSVSQKFTSCIRCSRKLRGFVIGSAFEVHKEKGPELLEQSATAPPTKNGSTEKTEAAELHRSAAFVLSC